MKSRKAGRAAPAGAKRQLESEATESSETTPKRARTEQFNRSTAVVHTPRTPPELQTTKSDRTSLISSNETNASIGAVNAQMSSYDEVEHRGFVSSKATVTTPPQSSKSVEGSTWQASQSMRRDSDAEHSTPILPIGAETMDNAKRKQQRKEQKKARRALQMGNKLAAKKSVESKLDRHSAKPGAVSEPLRTEDAEEDIVVSKDLATQPTWTISPSNAGRFLAQDPIFASNSDGQDFLIVGNDREVQLLSLDSSLIVATQPAPQGCTVRRIAPSAFGDSLVHILYSDGTVSKWDWMSSTPANRWAATKGSIKAMTLALTPDGETSGLFYISEIGRNHAIFLDNDQSLYVTQRPLHDVQILGNMDCIVAYGPSVIVLGTRNSSESELEYSWTEVPMTMTVTCADARLRTITTTGKKDSKKRREISLAISSADGQILLFEDISSLLAQQGTPNLPSPRNLHWHREAVSSIKFSRDGHYLISGGEETVLVLWQLETGNKQFLPHLTSAIERIVVSNAGDRYALQMGDNSIMVLSTSELKPVANFPGLQLTSPVLSSRNVALNSRTAAILNPRDSSQLLLTVPASRARSFSDISTRPFLQTFDLRNFRHIARQALARNNATDFNLGPEETPILPPDVAHLQISRDGSWLATVDEWMPPASDIGHLTPEDGLIVQEEQSKRREVFLKFWRWDASQALWTLTTRVIAPHARARKGAEGVGRVSAVVADPASVSFATIGEDNRVRIWKPKARMRSGVVMKGDGGIELVEWICKRTIDLPSRIERADSPMMIGDVQRQDNTPGCLAYSEDGSVLAAGHGRPWIYFIDPTTGSMTTKPTLTSSRDGDLLQIAFLDRYFLAVSATSVDVWDIVSDHLHRRYKLGATKADLRRDHRRPPILTVNHADGNFAVATRSAISVFDTRSARAAFTSTAAVQTPVEAILSGGKGGGYVVLFSDATVRTIGRNSTRSAEDVREALSRHMTSSARMTSTISVDDTDMEPYGKDDESSLPNLLAQGSSLKSVINGDRDVLTLDAELDDKPVVRPEQLSALFDLGPSFAMPPVRDMFRDVVGLFGRKRLDSALDDRKTITQS